MTKYPTTKRMGDEILAHHIRDDDGNTPQTSKELHLFKAAVSSMCSQAECDALAPDRDGG